MYEKSDRNSIPVLPAHIDWDNFNTDSVPFPSKYVSAENYETFRVANGNNLPRRRFVYDDTDPYGLRLHLRDVTLEDAGLYI